ncbi:hypothetical protein KAR91_87020 [Candidatus Pacearchaeota archaeon]|nr:hypothetical protein [Candidatus Pacearchaeota archaeon]
MMASQDLLKVREMIQDTSGKTASVTFRKRTGKKEITTRAIRTGVKRGVKGVGQNYNPADHDLITIFDMNRNNGPDKPKGMHINIPLDSILEFKCGDVHFVFEELQKS